MDTAERDSSSHPDFRVLVTGAIGWGWVLGIGGLYLYRHPLRLSTWKAADVFGGGKWHFPVYQATALLVAAISVGVAWGLGRAAGDRMGLWRRDKGLEGEAAEHAAAALGGLALLAMGVFVLGVVGLLVPLALGGLLVVAAALAWWLAPGRLRRRTFLPSKPGKTFPRGWMWVPTILCAAALVLSFLAALSPAIQSDGIRYHLYGPQEYLRAHRIHYIPHSAFTNFPFLTEMLFTLGMGLGNGVAAKLLHWIHLPLAALLISSLAGRMGRKEGTGRTGNGFGRQMAATVFLTTPVAAIVAGWSFIDLAITAYFLAMVWFLVRWIGTDGRPGDLWAAGFFAGAAIGTKYTMLLPAMLAGAIAFLRAAPAARERFRRAAVFALAAAVCGAPWFVKNVVLTGNPVYPLAYGIFDGGDWSKEAAKFYRSKAAEKGAHRGPILDFLEAPYDTAFNWPWFESQNPGPNYLLVLPFLAGWVALMWRRRRMATDAKEEEASVRTAEAHRAVFLVAGFAMVTGLVFFAGYKSNRFLLPVWALAAALAGGFAQGWNQRFSNIMNRLWIVFHPRTVAAAALCLGSIYGLYWTARFLVAEQKPAPLPAALGFENRNDYLSAALSYYPAVRWLSIQAENGEKAFYIGEYHGYPSAVPIGVSDWYDVPLILAYIRETPNNKALLDRLRAERYRFILVSYAELGAYGRAYFRPRFTNAEWTRFQDLLRSLRPLSRYEERGVVVYDIKKSG